MFFEKLVELAQANIPFVSVSLVDALGSIPQEVGAKILVTKDGLHYGTIGGGKLEKKVIDEAISLLNTPEQGQKTCFVQWNLNKDVGMTCGGTVRLYFELFNTRTWNIVVFGAGHVAQALIKLLIELDCRITCIDPRSEWLDKLPQSPKLTKILSEDMPSEVQHIEEGSFVLLLTMGHATDQPILLEILRTRKFPYLGTLGSKAKANILKKEILEAGLPESCLNDYYCPVGLDFGGNGPTEIAISVSAQLLQERDKLMATNPELLGTTA